MKRNYLLKKLLILFTMLICISSEGTYAGPQVRAEIIGRNIVDTKMVNESGIDIEVMLSGADFKGELTEEDKINIATSLEVDLDDGHIFDGERGNLQRLESIKNSRGDYLVSVGTDQNGTSIDSIDRFLSYGKGIGQEISKNGEIFINENKNLVIRCNSEYFKHFKNNIIYTQGGVPLAWGDIPIYVRIPKEIIKEATEDIVTSNFYAIIEMKAQVEILEYDDEDARQAKDENRTHAVDYISEEDIRKGGKLLKVIIKSRNGPTKWTIDRKKDPSFIGNMFRTSRDYGKNADNLNWSMVEDELGSNLDYGNDSLGNWNGYWISSIEDNRQETSLEDLKEMYYIIEFPLVKDFDIDEDMNVYISLLAGMIGGSGRSGKQGTPYWGQDGRLSFTILSGDDSDKAEPKKDQAGNDKGFGAGSGEDFGNEVGLDSGSDKDESDQEKKEDEQDKTQGSSGLAKEDKSQPRQVYEVSDEIIEETAIETDYNYSTYIIYLITIILTGAGYRYYRFSRFIKRGD